jgi:hypothetical protein
MGCFELNEGMQGFLLYMGIYTAWCMVFDSH